ncbi:MAG: RNA methyltransferase [Candidatus Kerfeldbacteria bacterium]
MAQSKIKLQHQFELVLVNVRSRFNVGAMFRTADAVGITKIHLCGYTPSPPHPKIDKVSLGAEKTVPFETHRTAVELLKNLQKQGYAVIAVEQSRGSIPYYRYSRPKKPIAIVMGSEVKGLSCSVLEYCDVSVEIPMHGKKESLNVAIAFGIVAYRLAFP